jgi:arabinofuranosyltransferase
MAKSKHKSSATRAKKAPAPQRLPRRSSRSGYWIILAGIAIAAAVLFYQARELWFTQDDAYISYRYAENALRGHGLVFNEGERVEGYTNFFWVILLLGAGRLGIGFDSAAKALGLISALGLIVLAAIWVRAAWRKMHWGPGVYPAAAAAVLVGCNGSLAYWAVSGLETAWFAFFLTLSVWLWLRRSYLIIATVAIATLSRPEGGMIFGLLFLAEWVWGDGPKRALALLTGTVLLLIPFGVFKLAYYGSLLPNPFYAKTGFSAEYIASGLDYTWLYLRQYGAYGLLAILTVVALFVLPRRWRIIPAIWLIYTLYITVIGGDVLKVHRFFVPITVPLAVSVAIAFGYLMKRYLLREPSPYPAAALLLVLALVTFMLPRDSIKLFRTYEVGLIQKMTIVGNKLRSTDNRRFSLAASTIGKISYDLIGHRVIDMLGLTDTTIARHPEFIPGNVSTWRERNFNATYVLEQDPDYILFSTGHKPSAPAERALMLHSKFRQNYYTAIYPSTKIRRNLAVYKRKGEFNKPDSVWPSIQLAQDINRAWNYSVQGNGDSAIALMNRIKHEGPGDFCVPDHFLADLWYRKERYDKALAYIDSALAIDSFSVVAWQLKGAIDQIQGDTLGLMQAVNHMSRIAPWLVNF